MLSSGVAAYAPQRQGKAQDDPIHKGGLAVLKQRNEVLYDRYLYEYDDPTFSGNSCHVGRNHLVAEAAVMFGSDYSVALEILEDMKKNECLHSGSEGLQM